MTNNVLEDDNKTLVGVVIGVQSPPGPHRQVCSFERNAVMDGLGFPADLAKDGLWPDAEETNHLR